MVCLTGGRHRSSRHLAKRSCGRSTARFLLTFDERPGQWMFHCHILDHADGGLMGTVNVGGVSTTDHAHGRPR
jgi:FtsP/CotA-like multicopper oxidase with cupredoxin domain